MMPTRTIAIGDIHGCSAALDALLDAIRPRPEDVIVPLGDYINRGPDTRGVLDRLIDLGRRCRLVPLLGNHEQMLLEARSGLHPTTWLGMGGLATLASYGHGRDLSLIPEEHFEFLEGCLDFHETDPRMLPTPATTPTCRWASSRRTCCGGIHYGTGFPAPITRARRSSSATRRRRPARSSTSAT